jgi:hypothetical protein
MDGLITKTGPMVVMLIPRLEKRRSSASGPALVSRLCYVRTTTPCHGSEFEALAFKRRSIGRAMPREMKKEQCCFVVAIASELSSTSYTIGPTVLGHDSNRLNWPTSTLYCTWKPRSCVLPRMDNVEMEASTSLYGSPLILVTTNILIGCIRVFAQ